MENADGIGGGQNLDGRERILRTASKLFYSEGTRAVGVDLIVARSGVAKTTLYRHFPSKDDLIHAFLEREDAEFWSKWDEVAEAHRNSPVAELEAQLRWIGERIARPGYRGCPQINIAAEYSDETHIARKVAIEHKNELRRRLEALATRIGEASPRTFALKMSLVVDGALSSGRALHQDGAAEILISIARTLLEGD